MEMRFRVLDQAERAARRQQRQHDRQHVRKPEADVRGPVATRRHVAGSIEGEAGDHRIGGKHGLELEMRAGADVLQPVIDDVEQPVSRTVPAARIVRRKAVVLAVVQVVPGEFAAGAEIAAAGQHLG